MSHLFPLKVTYRFFVSSVLINFTLDSMFGNKILTGRGKMMEEGDERKVKNEGIGNHTIKKDSTIQGVCKSLIKNPHK